MPHILHTIWLDSHEPTNKDTLWIKPLKKDYYGIFVYGSNGWVLTTALFKGTIGLRLVNTIKPYKSPRVFLGTPNSVALSSCANRSTESYTGCTPKTLSNMSKNS